MRRIFSNCASVSLFRLGVNTSPPKLNSRSTGALDGIVVLYLKKIFFIVGYLDRHSSFLALLKYSVASASMVLVEVSSSLSNS